jgi:CopG family transcriptional regulator, nickel-responsive regulator
MTISKEENTIRFSVSLPQTLLESLDSQVSQQGYSSRSEFIRDLIREQIIEDEWKDELNEVFGVLTLTYDHHQRELAQKIMDIQHDSYVHVLCTTHVHLCHDLCLETIIIRGKPKEIEMLSGEISGLRGVRAAKLTKTAKLPI